MIKIRLNVFIETESEENIYQICEILLISPNMTFKSVRLVMLTLLVPLLYTNYIDIVGKALPSATSQPTSVRPSRNC